MNRTEYKKTSLFPKQRTREEDFSASTAYQIWLQSLFLQRALRGEVEILMV